MSLKNKFLNGLKEYTLLKEDKEKYIKADSKNDADIIEWFKYLGIDPIYRYIPLYDTTKIDNESLENAYNSLINELDNSINIEKNNHKHTKEERNKIIKELENKKEKYIKNKEQIGTNEDIGVNLIGITNTTVSKGADNKLYNDENGEFYVYLNFWAYFHDLEGEWRVRKILDEQADDLDDSASASKKFKPYVEKMPVKEFLKFINEDDNANIYNGLEKEQSMPEEDWKEQVKNANSFYESYVSWYNSNYNVLKYYNPFNPYLKKIYELVDRKNAITNNKINALGFALTGKMSAQNGTDLGKHKKTRNFQELLPMEYPKYYPKVKTFELEKDGMNIYGMKFVDDSESRKKYNYTEKEYNVNSEKEYDEREVKAKSLERHVKDFYKYGSYNDDYDAVYLIENGIHPNLKEKRILFVPTKNFPFNNVKDKIETTQEYYLEKEEEELEKREEIIGESILQEDNKPFFLMNNEEKIKSNIKDIENNTKANEYAKTKFMNDNEYVNIYKLDSINEDGFKKDNKDEFNINLNDIKIKLKIVGRINLRTNTIEDIFKDEFDTYRKRIPTEEVSFNEFLNLIELTSKNKPNLRAAIINPKFQTKANPIGQWGEGIVIAPEQVARVLIMMQNSPIPDAGKRSINPTDNNMKWLEFNDRGTGEHKKIDLLEIYTNPANHGDLQALRMVTEALRYFNRDLKDNIRAIKNDGVGSYNGVKYRLYLPKKYGALPKYRASYYDIFTKAPHIYDN